MTPQQIIGMALRIAAAWLLLVTWQTFSIVKVGVEQLPDVSKWWFALAVLPAAIALFLWHFPMLVAHKLLPRLEDDSTSPLQEATSAAIVFVGLWAILQGVPHLSGALVVPLISGEWPELANQARSWLRIGFSYCALGLVLVMMPRFLARRIFPKPLAPPR